MGFLMEWKAHSLSFLFGVLSWVRVGIISSSLQPLGWCEDVCFPLLSVNLSVSLSVLMAWSLSSWRSGHVGEDLLVGRKLSQWFFFAYICCC
jgi:hypothetical protein